MKVSGKLSYKSAIIVNDVFFKDIDELLREYFEKPKYIKWNEFTIDDVNKEQKIVVINKKKLPEIPNKYRI